MSEHGDGDEDDDWFHWIGEGGGYGEDEGAEAGGAEGDGAEEADHHDRAEKFKQGSEKANQQNEENGDKIWENLKEFYDGGKHHDDFGGEEDEGEEEADKYGKTIMDQASIY